MLKQLYEWVLKLGEKKGGTYALSLISFIEASFFPIPPDPLLLALCLGKPKKSIYFGIICSIFSVLGAILGYYIGFGLWQLLDSFFFDHVFSVSAFEYVNQKYTENAFLAVLGAAFTPIPFKVFTVSAGVFKINLFVFIIACSIGRSARFMILSVLILFFGQKIKVFIDKYFNILAIIFFLLLILGFILLKKL
ncbi:MAG: YqaA family protein [Thermodesulfobacteriota bacterium]